MAPVQRLQAADRVRFDPLDLRRLDLQPRADGSRLLFGPLLGGASAERESPRSLGRREDFAGPVGLPASPASEKSAPARPLAAPKAPAAAPEEVLIVASRLKNYIRARSGFSTSDRVLEPLSVIVRRLCDEAVKSAAREGRTTVLERDIPSG